MPCPYILLMLLLAIDTTAFTAGFRSPATTRFWRQNPSTLPVDSGPLSIKRYVPCSRGSVCICATSTATRPRRGRGRSRESDRLSGRQVSGGSYGKKVVPVSNLAALARAGSGCYRAPILDARRGEVYAAVYDDQLRPVVDEVVTLWEDFLRLVGDREVSFLSQDSNMFCSGWGGADRTQSQARYRTVTVSTWFGRAAAQVAVTCVAEGKVMPPEAVDANYIRRPDAELKWKDPD